MNGMILGLILIIAGLVLLTFSLIRNKKVNVAANNSSMAVGGSNSGVMLNVNKSSAAPEPKKHGHGLTVLAMLVELVGIAVTLWHAMHLAGK